MKAYQLSMPTKVYFGRGILEDAFAAQFSFFKGTVMIVTTGRSLIRLGHLDMLKELLRRQTDVNNIIIYDQISANPKLKETMKGAELGKRERADIVIGFGGGSALDAAKAVAVGIGHDESLEDFFYNQKVPTLKTLPIVAIPTTAGTGSELSKAAIITDPVMKIKNGIRGAALYPGLAIVDSIFTETIPLQTTAETGFDVLAHAIESYVSKAATPYTEMLSEQAIQIVGKYLPRLMDEPHDTKAREKMSFASMIMGINLGNASTCLPHRLQYPVGAHTDTGHGVGLAKLFTAWVSYEVQYAGGKMKRAAELLNGSICEKEEDAVRIIENFIRSLNLAGSLRDIGVTQNLIEIMAEEVTGSIQNDPAAQKQNIIKEIYRMSY